VGLLRVVVVRTARWWEKLHGGAGWFGSMMMCVSARKCYRDVGAILCPDDSSVVLPPRDLRFWWWMLLLLCGSGEQLQAGGYMQMQGREK